ncbi:MAG: DNA primase, partial [Oscillospiraceae bacterium]|nr:DNA primase [Oscillospiraceae bacterium]
LSDYLSLLREWKTHYAPASPDEKPHDHFTEVCQMYGYIEYLVDILTVGNRDIRNQAVQVLMKDGKIDHLQDYILRMKEEQTHEQIA